MSGIAGIIHFDGRPVEPLLIEGMTAAMSHRGPDGIDHWRRGPVALGQCMLRTTPESLAEHQPLANEDESLVLVMDGRVDNWEELRRQLRSRGVALRSRADAELVLRAYETWGRDCLRHVDGDFALVIWDARRNEAFCARDRMGNKPFHYHWDGRTLAFASEPQALLALPWVREELNEGMVVEFLANEWLSRDETFWQGVWRLVAAHQMVVGRSGPQVSGYWEPDLGRRLPYATVEAFAEHYRGLLSDIARRLSRSNGPLACEVSGGLDSSAIFALAETLRRDGRLLAPSLDGYTLDFHDDTDANELDYARAVGRHLGVAIAEIPPTRKPLAWYRDRARRLRVFPSYPNGVMSLGIREAAQARGSRALLVGVGGDEWLWGSRAYYAETVAEGDWRGFADSLRADARDLGLRRTLGIVLRQGLASSLPAGVRRPLQRLRHRATGPQAQFRHWLAPAARDLLDRRRQAFPARVEPTPRAGQRAVLASLYDAFNVTARELEDGLAAAAGIELRRPFFATSLVEFALATPERYKLRGATAKYLHRVALQRELPQQVLARHTKADFTVAFRRSLAELKDPQATLSGGSQTWVPRQQIEWANAKVGEPGYCGLPEWRLWTLFGCVALTSGRRNGA